MTQIDGDIARLQERNADAALSLGRVREIIDEYVANDFRGIFLRPLSPYGFAVKTKWIESYDATKWSNFYFARLDYIIELNKRGIPFREFYAATILTKMLTPFQPGFVDLMSPAGIGIGALVYNYDGSVYAIRGSLPQPILRTCVSNPRLAASAHQATKTQPPDSSRNWMRLGGNVRCTTLPGLLLTGPDEFDDWRIVEFVTASKRM